MFDGDLGKCAVKGPVSAQPLVGDDGQRILVTGGTWVRLNLFGGHVGDGADGFLCELSACTLRDHGDAEVAEQNFPVAPQQHILRLDVAMDDFLVVRVLQRARDLVDILYDGFNTKSFSTPVKLA